jgi:hypothetical protein
MAVKSTELHKSVGARNVRRPLVSAGHPSLHTLVYLLTAGLALLAVYALLSTALTWGRAKLDDLRYGNPRTYHLAAFVGHEETDGSPTQLIAMNLDRQVVVIEVPGGDPSKVRALPGPYLFGAGEDKTPVTMKLADVNGDAHDDLIVRIKNEEMIYLNAGGTFQLITPEQRKEMLQSAQ